MKNMLRSILESLSLTFFLIYIHTVNMNVRQDWLAPYFISGIVGLLVSIYLIKRDIVLNRIFLGINLYFLSGLFGLTIKWDWLNQLYGQLGAVAMLYWILVVGALTSVLSPYGFLGLNQPSHYSIKISSLLLLGISLAVTLMALYFTGSQLMGEWIPFIILFSSRSILLQWKRKN